MSLTVMKHLTLGLVLTVGWVLVSGQLDGIVWDSAVILGAVHLGAVMTKTWPK